MRGSDDSLTSILAEKARDWRLLMRPSVVGTLLLGLGVPTLIVLSLLLDGPVAPSRSPGADLAAAPATAGWRAPTKVSAPRHRADQAVAVLDGDPVTVSEVKALVADHPERVRNLRFNRDVTRSEASDLLGAVPTPAQLPVPAPEYVLVTGPTVPAGGLGRPPTAGPTTAVPSRPTTAPPPPPTTDQVTTPTEPVTSLPPEPSVPETTQPEPATTIPDTGTTITPATAPETTASPATASPTPDPLLLDLPTSPFFDAVYDLLR